MVAGEEAGEAWLLSLARGTEGVCCLPTLDPYPLRAQELTTLLPPQPSRPLFLGEYLQPVLKLIHTIR